MKFTVVYNGEVSFVDDEDRDQAAHTFARDIGISHYRNLRHVRAAVYRAEFEFGDGKFKARRFEVRRS